MYILYLGTQLVIDAGQEGKHGKLTLYLLSYHDLSPQFSHNLHRNTVSVVTNAYMKTEAFEVLSHLTAYERQHDLWDQLA